MAQFTIESTWRAVDTVDVPDGVDPNEAFDAINRGELPQWAADQVDAGGADLVDWTAKVA